MVRNTPTVNSLLQVQAGLLPFTRPAICASAAFIRVLCCVVCGVEKEKAKKNIKICCIYSLLCSLGNILFARRQSARIFQKGDCTASECRQSLPNAEARKIQTSKRVVRIFKILCFFENLCWDLQKWSSCVCLCHYSMLKTILTSAHE